MSIQHRLLLLVLPLVLLTACANVIDFLPKEIQDAEQPSIDAAKALLAAHPQALQTITVNARSITLVQLQQPQPPRPLVIFVHGSPGLWRSWVRYLQDPDLQRAANLIALDRPGFGGSGSGRFVKGFVAQAEAIAPLLKQAQPGQRVILVGHAYSAALVMRMAMNAPAQVTDLVLTAAPLDPGLQTESWFQYLADWSVVTWLLPDELVVFNREYLGLEKELTDMLPLWGKVTARVSLLLGEDDEEVPIATADFARRMLTHARAVNVVRMPGTNHFIPWTRFEAVKAQLLSHLGPLEP